MAVSSVEAFPATSVAKKRSVVLAATLSGAEYTADVGPGALPSSVKRTATQPEPAPSSQVPPR